MRTEVPEVKRACFCFPLRYSLLLWGYVNLISNIFNLYTMIVVSTDVNPIFSNIYCKVIIVTMILVDFILVVIFIIGAHKKSFKLIKIFYFYDLSLLIFEMLMSTAFVIWLFCMIIQHGKLVSTLLWKILMFASLLTTYFIIRGYFLLLVRSEILKLSNTCQFRFVNNAVESECTMKCEITGDEELGLEKSNEETFESKNNCPENMGKITNESEGNMKYKEFSDEETENISNEETSKRKYTCIEKGKLAKEPKRNMKYEKLGDELGL